MKQIALMGLMAAVVAVGMFGCSGGGSDTAGDGGKGGGGTRLGDLQVSWLFENATTCADAKVSFVEVLITRTDTGVKEFDQAFDCLGGSAVVTDLLSGKYAVTLNGLDSGGYTRYQTVVQTELKSGSNDLGTVVLDFILGSIAFSWSFDGVADCKVTGVSTVQIVVLDSQDQTVFNETNPCTDGGVKVMDFLPGKYTLVLYGLDVASTRLYETRKALSIKVGDNEYGMVDLKPSQ